MDAARLDCLWTDLGQEGGDGGRVARVHVVYGSSSSHHGQAQLEQAAGVGGLRLIQLEETGGKESSLSLATWSDSCT